MKKQIEGVAEQLLKFAKEEFLKKGFIDASLRDIAQNSGVSTSSIYTRFGDKEGLFDAVVRQTISDLEKVVEQQGAINITKLSNTQLCNMCDLSQHEQTLLQWFEFLYARREDMFLLLARSSGSKYANFQHDWVEKIMEANYPFFEEIQGRGLTEFNSSKRELHILQSAYWQTLYEPFIHEASWEEIKEHSRYVSRFFNWPSALGFKKR